MLGRCSTHGQSSLSSLPLDRLGVSSGLSVMVFSGRRLDHNVREGIKLLQCKLIDDRRNEWRCDKGRVTEKTVSIGKGQRARRGV